MPNPKLLAEGLKNFEDLDITAFIDAVRRIGQMQAAEILDGSKLYFGLDDSGKFYTSRSMKRTGERYYTELDYPLFASNNGLRAAHLALQYREKDIKIAFSPGDLAEVEIIYGRQPKAVSYGLHGSNFISLTRGIDPTPDSKVQSLASELEHKEVVVKSIVVDTPDGVNLERESVIQTFSFVGQQKI